MDFLSEHYIQLHDGIELDIEDYLPPPPPAPPSEFKTAEEIMSITRGMC